MIHLAEIRKSRGLTQEQLAEMLGVNQCAISFWESGRSYPRLPMAYRIALILGVKIDDLIDPIELRP